MSVIKNKALKLFFIVVITLSIIVDVLLISTGNGVLYPILMWVPAIAALVANIYEQVSSKEKFDLKKLLNGLGFKLCNIKYILLGILLPLIYLLIPYIIYWIKYPNNFAYTGVPISLILSDCLPVMVIGIVGSLISAIGEEIGWRGYMVPALNEKYGAKKTLVISSLFWCLWHFPLIIFDAYMSNLPLYYQLPMFVLCIFPVGVICGIYALKTSSVWPSAFLHAAHNNYDQTVFQVITRGENMFYYVSETGIVTAICAWIVMGVILIINRKRISN